MKLENLNLRMSATVDPGVKTQRIAKVRGSRSRKLVAGRILAGRTVTEKICMSLGAEDLHAIDADAEAARLSRSTYLVECWKKARGL